MSFNNSLPFVNNTNVPKQKRPGRGRRKHVDNSNNFFCNKKSKIETCTKQPSLLNGYPVEHPYNKDGYRYILAEPDPLFPDLETDVDQQGQPIPAKQYRKVCPEKVMLAMHDRPSVLKLSDDRMEVMGFKGYNMLRATHYVETGSWYFEVKILEHPETSAFRMGWSMKHGTLQAPLGYDKFGYSWRSKKGTLFHQSIGKSYSKGYSKGDVLGFYIHLPVTKETENFNKETYKDCALINFKRHYYFEERDDVEGYQSKLKPLRGSFMEFFKNGVSQGRAFEDKLANGAFFPAGSIYKSGVVRFNFGPNFDFPPPGRSFKGVGERAEEFAVEATLADLLYAANLDVKGERV